MADNIDVTSGVGNTVGADDISSVKYQRVKLIHGVDGTNDGDVASSNPFPVTVNRVTSLVDGTVSVSTVNRVNNVVDGTLSTVSRVSNVVDGTISTVTTVGRVNNVVDGTISTVTFVPVVQRVQNLIDGTVSVVTTVGRVNNVVDGTLSSVYRVHNLIDGTVKLSSSSSSMAVYFDRGSPNVTATYAAGTFVVGGSIVSGGTDASTDGPVKVGGRYNSTKPTFTDGQRGDMQLSSRGAVISTLFANDTSTAISAEDDNSDAVAVSATANNLSGVSRNTVYNGTSWDRQRGNTGGTFVNAYHTAGIFTVSGTTSTAGNNTLVAPSASYNFKIYAYSIQTTGIVSAAPRFTTGASAGATELWRPLITAAASSSAPVGANLTVSPPGFIFATGVSTTLSLYLDTGSLVHYSVSYIKESA